MLVVMMGLPGTGESAVAQGVARAIGAPVFSVDPLEATLNRYGITREQRSDYAAYGLAATLARSQLSLGQSAVADAVNSIELVRAWWRDMAADFGVPRALIECVCSDADLHRWRIERRNRNIEGFIYEPSWADIEARRAEYEPCTEERLVLDAVRPLGRQHPRGRGVRPLISLTRSPALRFPLSRGWRRCGSTRASWPRWSARAPSRSRARTARR